MASTVIEYIIEYNLGAEWIKYVRICERHIFVSVHCILHSVELHVDMIFVFFFFFNF